MNPSGVNHDHKEQCLVDSATTHTILKNKEYFTQLTVYEGNVNTISGVAKLIEGSGKACLLLPRGTKLIIKDALYSRKSQRNLLSFKDVRQNGFHIETMNENGNEYLCLTAHVSGRREVVEKLPAYSSGLYFTHISPFEINMVSRRSPDNHKVFNLWHD